MESLRMKVLETTLRTKELKMKYRLIQIYWFSTLQRALHLDSNSLSFPFSAIKLLPAIYPASACHPASIYHPAPTYYPAPTYRPALARHLAPNSYPASARRPPLAHHPGCYRCARAFSFSSRLIVLVEVANVEAEGSLEKVSLSEVVLVLLAVEAGAV